MTRRSSTPQPTQPAPPLTCTKPQSGWSAQCSSSEGQQQPRRSTRSRRSISARGTCSWGELSGGAKLGQAGAPGTVARVAVPARRARPAHPGAPSETKPGPSLHLAHSRTLPSCIPELTFRRGARSQNSACIPCPHAYLPKQPSTLIEPRALSQKQLSHCDHTSNPEGTTHPACTPTETAVHTHRLLPAPSLTPQAQHHEITRCVHPLCSAGPHCAHCNGGTSVRTPCALARSAEPWPPASGRELPPRLRLRPHPSSVLRHLAWRRPQPILGAGKGGPGCPRGRICSPVAGRPPFKASRLPSPPPSRRGLGPHPGDCAGAWGLHMPRRSAGHWSKSLRAAWASRAAEPGAGARRARTGRRARWLPAAPGRAGREGRHPVPRAREGGRGGGGGRGKSPRCRLEPAARALPGSPPFPVAPRGCPGRGGARALPAGHAGPREAATRGAGRERPLGPQGCGRRRNK